MRQPRFLPHPLLPTQPGRLRLCRPDPHLRLGLPAALSGPRQLKVLERAQRALGQLQQRRSSVTRHYRIMVTTTPGRETSRRRCGRGTSRSTPLLTLPSTGPTLPAIARTGGLPALNAGPTLRAMSPSDLPHSSSNRRPAAAQGRLSPRTARRSYPRRRGFPL